MYYSGQMPPENDKEILAQIKEDPQAFALLYDRYYDAIFSYVFRRLAIYEAARDITAETFLKAFQYINSFKWKGIPVSAWIYRIATNEINLYFRRSKYKTSGIDALAHVAYDEGIETEKAALEKALQENNEFMTVQKQLRALKTRYQEVIALRYFEEKSIREISEILDKNEGTVKSLLSRGLEKLRQRILNPEL